MEKKNGATASSIPKHYLCKILIRKVNVLFHKKSEEYETQFLAVTLLWIVNCCRYFPCTFTCKKWRYKWVEFVTCNLALIFWNRIITSLPSTTLVNQLTEHARLSNQSKMPQCAGLLSTCSVIKTTIFELQKIH